MNVMMESEESEKPSLRVASKSHDGIIEKLKTIMTYSRKKSCWNPQKGQNHHDIQP